jgi:hypothetical protein
MSYDDARTQEIIQGAKPTSLDTEERLSRMRRIKAVLIPELEAEYTALRDQLVRDMDGPRVFLDDREGKLIGFKVEPDKTVLHEEVLDELPEDVVAEIAPRKISRDKLANAIAAGRVPQSVAARIMTIIPKGGTAHIRFIDTGDKAGDEG